MLCFKKKIWMNTQRNSELKDGGFSNNLTTDFYAKIAINIISFISSVESLFAKVEKISKHKEGSYTALVTINL